MNESEVLKTFNRINGGCLGCSHWRGDRVRAAVGRFLTEHWDHVAGQPLPTPPTLEQLARLCCHYEPGPDDIDPSREHVGTFVKAGW